VGKVFFDAGDDTTGFEKGEFIVEGVSENNNFACSRVGGESDDKGLFDMSYVIALIRKYDEE
jgi:hypothetical protein